MSQCSKCGSKVSFWNEYSIEGKSYCEKCGKARDEKEKKELEQKENQERETITPVYCKDCGRRYNTQGGIREFNASSIVGIILLVFAGFGFISWTRKTCPYCEGKLKRYKGQELNVKNFSWAEPKTISASELKVAEKRIMKISCP